MRFLLTIMIILPMLSIGQDNLVPNPSFEEFTSCPDNISQIYLCPPWVNPTEGSPEYFNVCGPPEITPPDTFPRMGVPENQFGTQHAKDGDAYVGIYTFLKSHEGREYIQIELTEPLFYRIPYAVSFYVSVAEKSHYAISQIGAHLSVDAIHRDDYLTFDVVPQILPDTQQPMMDTTAWVLITDTIVSQDGGERFLTIGNFNSDAETDTVLFNPQPNSWQLSYYYIDDVSVVALDSVPSGVGINELEREHAFKVYPNPNKGAFSLSYNLNEYETGNIEVFSAIGQKMYSGVLQSNSQTQSIELREIPAGIYQVRVIVNGDVKLSSKLVILK